MRRKEGKMEDKIIEFTCKKCGLIWYREFAEDCVEEISNINLNLAVCPACIYG